jgi:hypothetical protein
LQNPDPVVISTSWAGVVDGGLQMNGATLSFVIFWTAVGGSTLLVLLARNLRRGWR